MKLKNFSNIITSKLGRQVLLAQKHSPHLLFAAGVVGVVGTVILASRATLKLEEVLGEHEDLTHKAEIARTSNLPNYTEADYKRDMVLVYTKTTTKILRLYAPSIVTGVAAICALSGAHFVLNRRNVALTAAYAAVEKGFREYRRRVVEEYGEEKDREFRYELENKEIVEETDEGPVVKTVKTLVGKGASPYAFFFDQLSPSWNNNFEYNAMFLRSQQNYANDLLNARGHVFLNEVLSMLGIPHTKAGAVVGWLKGGEGDGFVDFGVFRNNEQRGMEFVRGDAPGILLDFNVDGIIYDKI